MNMLLTQKQPSNQLVQKLILACQLEPELLAQDQASLQLAVKHYCQTLVQTPRVMKRLKLQGFKQGAIDYFQLGFADRSLGKSLGDSRRTNSAIVRGALERAELLKANGHPVLRGYVVFPVTFQGIIYGAYGFPAAPYLNKPITTERVSRQYLFHQDGLLMSDRVLLCLEPHSAVRLWQLGWHNVVSLIRLQLLSEQQLSLLKAYQCQLFIISGKGNSEFIRRLQQQLKTKGIQAEAFCLSHHLTLSQLLSQKGKTQQQLHQLIKEINIVTSNIAKEPKHE